MIWLCHQSREVSPRASMRVWLIAKSGNIVWTFDIKVYKTNLPSSKSVQLYTGGLPYRLYTQMYTYL